MALRVKLKGVELKQCTTCSPILSTDALFFKKLIDNFLIKWYIKDMRIRRVKDKTYRVVDGRDQYGPFKTYKEATDFIEYYLSVLYEYGIKA